MNGPTQLSQLSPATAEPEKAPPPQPFTLAPIAVIEMAEQGQYFLKVRGGVPGCERTAWMALSQLQHEYGLRRFVADSFGYVVREHDPLLESLAIAANTVPRLVGTSRLGWTPQRDAFLYGSTVVTVAPDSTRAYEFVAPVGTLLKRAEEALQPTGSREAQYQAFRKLWEQSADFRLVLSLAAVSPFLEVINAPSIVFHLAGLWGSGKTTLLRLGLSVYANPDSPLTRIDFSKV
jgi:hypothetical protein